MRLSAATVAALLVVLIAGCGGDDAAEPSGSGGGEPAAKLTVTVRPDGPDGPARRRTIECARLGPNAPESACRRLAGLTADQLAPVPAGTACTQIYGGPAVAQVRGELRGKPVDARFELTDGCEIERWDRNRVLLHDAPRG
ncbi:MAG: hypothetical protein H0T69_10445 [Thermoleophilaceae bacterium]|nr:hypothetical protein [Thermoleophilaceae bacterium]